MTEQEYMDLLPVGATQALWDRIRIESTAMQLGRVIRMSETTEKFPVMALRPQTDWVNPRYGGRKPPTQVKWEMKEITAEEIAGTLAIPTQWLIDARTGGNFNPEGDVEETIAEDTARVIDEAILFGTNAPSVFPEEGLLGGVTIQTDPDALTAIDAAMGDLENHNLTATGIAARPVIGSALRQAYREVAALPGERPAPTLYGVPVSTARIWDNSEADAIVGDWSYLVICMREDIQFGRSDQGVLIDPATGDIVANAFQDNLTLIKVFMRLGWALGKPVDPISNEPIEPFAGAKWTE
jgi:hypothetical protein